MYYSSLCHCAGKRVGEQSRPRHGCLLVRVTESRVTRVDYNWTSIYPFLLTLLTNMYTHTHTYTHRYIFITRDITAFKHTTPRNTRILWSTHVSRVTVPLCPCAIGPVQSVPPGPYNILRAFVAFCGILLSTLCPFSLSLLFRLSPFFPKRWCIRVVTYPLLNESSVFQLECVQPPAGAVIISLSEIRFRHRRVPASSLRHTD